jgi:hypothetical protein
MFNQSEQFIIQMKLRELRKQRSLLMSAYDRLDGELNEAANDTQRLHVLYNGLRRISFAGHQLHPEVANLEPVLYNAETAQPDSDTVTFWKEKLQKELATGRLRSEIVFIFAALLEEWTQEETRANRESDRVRAELLTKATTPNTATFDREFLDELFAETGYDNADTAATFQSLLQQKHRIESREVRTSLEAISHDLYYSPSARKQAQSLLLDDMLVKEFADALTLIYNEIDSWDWPREGVPVFAYLTPSKWRLFLSEELPTLCLLQILGGRWQQSFEQLFGLVHHFRGEQLRKTIQNLPPAERVQQMLDFHRAAFGVQPGIYGEIDIWGDDESDQIRETDLWDDPANVHEKYKQKTTTDELLQRWATRDSVYGQRVALRTAYRDLSQFGLYNRAKNDNGLAAMEKATLQINAELRLAQAAFPDRPLYVLRADLKDYYPALSHEFLLEILARFGLNKEQLRFFGRYLRVPVKEKDGTVVTITRGIPMHRRLADLLGEMVLLLLDAHIKRSARVLNIRMIDDICLIAASEEEAVKAWQALEEFCAACGLELNREKCGAVGVGQSRPLPPVLPQNLPIWSFITLNNKGEWSVNDARFATYIEQTRQQLNEANSLIAKVEVYNNALNYLVKALALRLRLDETHRQTAGQALARFQREIFGNGRAVAEELRELLRQRFLTAENGDVSDVQLPDGWLHWPITAGGLSLFHSLIMANSYATTFNRRSKITPPDERSTAWQRRASGWHTFYARYLQEIEPSSPDSNDVMETLVRDFIRRGSEISLGEQTSLSAYWRWVVYIYGPQILERLGTFRFLITELVPAQLITGKYRQGTEQAEISGTDWDNLDTLDDFGKPF